MKNAITEISSGLQNYDPKRAEEGMGGTYFLKNYNGENIYCFKPQDEEPMAPNNPHDFVGTFGSSGLRPSIKSGWSCIREVAAYYMDKNHFSGVPATTLAEMSSKSFNYNDNGNSNSYNDNKYIPKLGSLQKFVECDDLLIDRSSKILSVMDVHKIGILDIRILNLDRNEENILLKQEGRSKVTNEIIWKAIPIDHGYSIPSTINIGWCDWCWFEYPQAKVPFDKETKDYIKSINIEEDITFLREKLKINEACIRNLRVSNLLLQIGVERGLTLYEIAYMMLRLDTNMERESMLEQCCELSETLLQMSLKNMKERGKDTTTINNTYKMISNNNLSKKYSINVNPNFDEMMPSPEVSPHQSARSVLSELKEEINKKQPAIIPNQSPLSDSHILYDTPQMSPMLVGSFMSLNNNNSMIKNNNLNGFSLDDNINENENEDKELSFGSFNDFNSNNNSDSSNIFNFSNIEINSSNSDNRFSIESNYNNNNSLFESTITDQPQSKSEPCSTTKKSSSKSCNNNIFSIITSPLLQPSYAISMDCPIPTLLEKIQTNNNNSLLFTDKISNPECTNKPPLNPDDLPIAEPPPITTKSNNNNILEEEENEDKCTPLISKTKIDNTLVRTCSYTANYTLSKKLIGSNSNSSVNSISHNKRSKTPKNKRMKSKDDEKEKLFFVFLFYFLFY